MRWMGGFPLWQLRGDDETTWGMIHAERGQFNASVGTTTLGQFESIWAAKMMIEDGLHDRELGRSSGP
jgi:hypothetical protein